MKRFLALMLALLTVIPLLAGCGDAGVSDETTASSTTAAPSVSTETTVPAETEVPRITPDLPEANFNGHAFTVLTRGQFSSSWFSRDIYAETMTGEVINDAVYKRNQKIEEQYGFKVVEIGVEDGATVAKNSILAQNDEYDMICIRLKDHISSLTQQGLLLDLKTIPLLDLDQPYYNQNSMQSLSLANKVYAMTGDLLTMDNDATRCVLFNKALWSDLQLTEQLGGSLYELVKTGKWTLEKLEAASASAVADLNGDQKMDNNDRWGMANEAFNSLGLLNATGITLFEKDASTDIPVFAGNTERTLSALEQIIPLVRAEHSLYGAAIYEVVHPNFQAGNILFHLANLCEVRLYRGMEFDFGIIPMPKFDEAQDRYYSTVTTWGSNCISVPITASDLDRTATIIEALSCESMYTVTPAYFELSLEGRMLRDEESADMLEIILDTAIFDLSFMWNWGNAYSALQSATDSNNPNLTSVFKSLERICTAAVKNSLKNITE